MIQDFSPFAKQTIEELKEDLKSIRTGRANPALVEDLSVDAYGGSTKLRLREMATITTEGATAILIMPFDPSSTPDIEKAILSSPLGVTPQAQGHTIRVQIPPMSKEQRERMVKIVGQKVEETKETIRKKRDEKRKKIKHALDAKEMSEDDKYRMEKELDTETTQFMEDIQRIKDKKEGEIMEV